MQFEAVYVATRYENTNRIRYPKAWRVGIVGEDWSIGTECDFDLKFANKRDAERAAECFNSLNLTDETIETLPDAEVIRIAYENLFW